MQRASSPAQQPALASNPTGAYVVLLLSEMISRWLYMVSLAYALAHLAVHLQKILTAQQYLPLSEDRKAWADAPTEGYAKGCSAGVVQILAA